MQAHLELGSAQYVTGVQQNINPDWRLSVTFIGPRHFSFHRPAHPLSGKGVQAGFHGYVSIKINIPNIY